MQSIGLIEEKLLNMIAENAEVIERSLNQCTDKMFDKLTLPKLSDFIWERDPNVLMKNDIPRNKGKLEDTKYAVKHSQQQTRIVFTPGTCA